MVSGTTSSLWHMTGVGNWYGTTQRVNHKARSAGQLGTSSAACWILTRPKSSFISMETSCGPALRYLIQQSWCYLKKKKNRTSDKESVLYSHF